MPFIIPNSAGTLSPETVTVTFSLPTGGIGGLVRGVQFAQERGLGLVFGLNGARAVALSMPKLGRLEMEGILLPASSQSEYDALLGGFVNLIGSSSGLCGQNISSITVNFTCNNNTMSIKFKNAILDKVVGAMAADNFLFFQAVGFSFSGYA